MRPQLLDVEYAHAVRRENLLGGKSRKVRKMLMVDLVELVAGHRFEQMRKFDRADPARLQDDANPFDERVQVRDLGEDVVAENKVGLDGLFGQLVRRPDAEEFYKRRDSEFFGGPGNVRRRVDAEDGDPSLDKEL